MEKEGKKVSSPYCSVLSREAGRGQGWNVQLEHTGTQETGYQENTGTGRETTARSEET